jgi:Putative peptidoglycan binding domain
MGGGHGMGGMHMGGMGRGGFGGRGMAMRGRPATSSGFFSHNGTNHFAQHQNLASGNHNVSRSSNRGDRSVDRRDQFRDSHGLADRGVDRRDRAFDHRGDRSVDRRDQFRDSHGLADRGVDRRDRAFDRGREGREGEEREGRERRDFFFRNRFFVGFDFAAFGLGWWWGPWWDWWYPSGYYGYYPYYGDYPSYDDPPGDNSQYGSQNGSQNGSQYWTDLAKSVQSKLTEQSYYQGSIDGVIGSDTLQAIRQYQADHGLAVTGKIDPKLLDALGVEYKQQS